MVDRIPPYSLEAEQGVLGCVLLSPQDCLGECVSSLKAGADSFYDIRHRTIYGVLVEMYDSKQPIDTITLHQRLKDGGLLEDAGGVGYLSELPDRHSPSAYNLASYLDIVRAKYVLRRMLATCAEVESRIFSHEGEVDTLLDWVEKSIHEVGSDRVESVDVPVKELVKKELEFFEACHGNNGAVIGISTGFRDLDRMTTGLKGGDMVVIAARPSLGKTSLAMNIADSVAVNQKLPVGIFSLEMTRQSLVRRMMCGRGRVNERHILQGVTGEAEQKRMFTASVAVAGAPLHIDDTGNMPILQLRARARRMHQRYGIRLLIIDYLQLLKAVTNRNDNRVNELTNVSNGIKALAKELDIPIIALAQLSRDIERDGNRKPRLSDLRECGAIEQDADVVGMLYRPEENPDPAQMVVPINLYINKQRNGPTGDVEFTFFKEFTRFEPRAKDFGND